MDSRRVINLSVVLLTALVLGPIGWMASDAFHEYRVAREMERANGMADHLIHAVGILGRERGLVAAVLGTRQPVDPATRARIEELRQQGDAAWDAALEASRELMVAERVGESFRFVIDKAGQAYRQVQDARGRVDSCLDRAAVCSVGGEDWLAAMTRFIETAGRMREEIFLAVTSAPEVVQSNLTMKRWAVVATENAGRERGFLGYYIGARRPVPREIQNNLHVYRGVVERTTREMLAFSERPDTDPRIVAAVRAMRAEFLGEFEHLRRRVYAAADSGDYPVSVDDWLVAATRAIDTLLAISEVMSIVTDEHVRHSARVQANQMALHALIAVLALALAAVGLTRVRQTAHALYQQKELAETTLHSIGDAVITTDAAAQVEYLNPVAEDLTGWSSQEARGRPLAEVFRIVNGLSREAQANPVEACLRERRVVGLASNTLLVRRDGNEFVIEDSAAPIVDYDGRVVGAVMVFYDVSQMRRVPHLLSYHATHDSLTGLINRREFERRLADLLASARQDGRRHALAYIDLDQFKVVNDTCGHGVGDRLLCQLTYLLQERVREDDTLARLGGDEFGLLIESCDLDAALQITDSLRQVIKDFRFVWEGRTFDIGVSIGLVPITADSVNPAEILSEADAACFAAKEKGRNRVQVYQPGDLELTRRHGEMQWVSRLREALEENRFRLYCQTIAPLDDERTLHGEVLLRLEDRDGTLVPPLAFLPAAERYNLMPEIDRWVIRTALGLIGGHLRDRPGHGDLMCNINLSGASLGDEGLQAYIVEELERHGVPPAVICFEITESAAIANLERAAALMHALRDAGCRFALDDFGSGLSSFAYLKTLPVDYLKIDGTFVRGVADDPVARAMVQAIHTVGHVMGIRTVAEYVEDERILAEIRRIGVDYAQGYGIGHPRPMAECLSQCGRAS